jgi:transposase
MWDPGTAMGLAPMRTHGATTSTKADGFRRIEVITGVGRRRRWSDEDKARIVAESLDPATTASAVARRHGLHVSQLFTWRQQQLQRSASRAETIGGPAFVPVLLSEDGAAPAEAAAGRMEIVLGSVVVRIGADVDAAALRRVLEVVRSLP